VDYMREALRGVPEKPRSIPEGIVEMKVNAATGGRKDADLDPLFEYFRIDALPTDEGYQGDMGVSPADIDPSTPNAPQSGSDPIF
jgi:membrane carboxypeptidase/penicillin-binding protein